MKAIQYILMGVLALGPASAMAQNDSKAVIEQASKIITSKSGDVAAQIKEIYKANKKNPEVLVGIGQAYLNVRDTANANVYADYALKRNGKFAKAWVLKGDIAVMQDDGGLAATNYQNAMYYDPKDPEGYYKYALVMRGVSPDAAVETLEKLRQQRPDYPVDQLTGRIYYNAGKFEQAVEAYSKVPDVKSMNDEDITYFAISEWLLGNREKSIGICKQGLAKDPRRAAWNRVAFYNYTDLKDADNALAYADKLFNQSDSAHFTGEDYTYYGTALKLVNRNDEAMEAFKKAIEFNKDNSKQLVILNKHISDLYLAKEDYDNAISYLRKTFAEKPTMDDFENLAGIYTDIAAKKTQAAEKEADATAKAADTEAAASAFREADKIYGEMQAAYPNYANYCNYMRGQINANLDPDSKQGLAKPFYEALANALSQKAEISDSERAMLKQAYTYMIVYAFNVQQDKDGAKQWAAKLQQIDPENDIAKQVLAM